VSLAWVPAGPLGGTATSSSSKHTTRVKIHGTPDLLLKEKELGGHYQHSQQYRAQAELCTCDCRSPNL
jgi:hypothetical protein